MTAASGFVPSPDPRPDDVAWPRMRWPVPADVLPVGGTLPGTGPVLLSRVEPDADAARLFRALDDDRVWRHLTGRPAGPADLAATLHHRADVLGWHQWLVRAATDGNVLGMSSYLSVTSDDAWLEIGCTAYTLTAWGGPVNPATKLALLGVAFDGLGAGRVQLVTDVRNHRSQRAIARLGATREGVLRRHKRRDDGTVRDSVVFSVVAEQWAAVRAGLLRRLAPEPGHDGG